MVEAEEAFVEDISQVTQSLESLIKESVRYAMEDTAKSLATLQNAAREESRQAVRNLLDKDFVTMTYQEAFEILKRAEHLPPIQFGESLSRAHELYLTETHCSGVRSRRIMVILTSTECLIMLNRYQFS